MSPDAKKRAAVAYVGLLPPPVTGQRLAGQKIVDRLSAETDVHVFRLLTARGESRLWRGLRKALKSIMASVWLVFTRFRFPHVRLFMMPSAGPGRWLDLFLGILGRGLGYRVFLRYPVYSYIDEYDHKLAWFVGSIGTHGGHFLLCEEMKDDFVGMYSPRAPCYELSNGFGIPVKVGVESQSPEGALHLGHISNLAVEKGLDEVLATYSRMRENKVPVVLHLAGPFSTDTERVMVEKACERHEGIRYWGAVYDEEKWEFFGHLDAMLFPTRYRHEGQPNVVVESLISGVPVLSYARACIPALIGERGGVAFDRDEDFVDKASTLLTTWAEYPALLHQAKTDAEAQGERVRAKADQDLERLVEILVRGVLS